MAKQPNTRLVGVFILSGLVIFLIILAAFMRNKLISDDKYVAVMYFEESIKGLNVGSPVVFMGVEVGKVSKINLVANPDNMDFDIPVYVRFTPKQGILSEKDMNARELLDIMIKRGLRARLTTQSLLTGQLMIELEMLPGTPVVLKQEIGKHHYLEIPTVLSQIKELSRDVQNLPLRDTVDKINVLLPQATKAFKDFDNLVVKNSVATGLAIDNFSKAMKSVNDAAKSMRNLTDYLERHPEAVLKGKPRGN